MSYDLLADLNLPADVRERARALGRHNPPRRYWWNAAGELQVQCITDDPNPDCVGCQKRPPAEGRVSYWRRGGCRL